MHDAQIAELEAAARVVMVSQWGQIRSAKGYAKNKGVPLSRRVQDLCVHLHVRISVYIFVHGFQRLGTLFGGGVAFKSNQLSNYVLILDKFPRCHSCRPTTSPRNSASSPNRSS